MGRIMPFLLGAAGVGAIIMGLGGNVGADTIGVNFAAGTDSFGTAPPLLSTGSAGIIPAVNWNNESSGPGTNVALNTATGATPSGLTVSWSTGQVVADGNSLTASSPPDKKLMDGYLDVGSTATVKNLPTSVTSGVANAYAVIVYFNGYNSSGTNRVDEITVSDGTSSETIDGMDVGGINFNIPNSSPGLFAQVRENSTTNSANTAAGNYMVFTNDGNSGSIGPGFTSLSQLTITAVGGYASDGNARAPDNGFQIVPLSALSTPEPATLALLAAAGASLLLVPRKKAARCK